MNKNLPIFNFKSEIVSAVEKNDVTIITAETGAGKSTQVPQFLLKEGHDLIVTEPRRLAARSLAGRVANERRENLGQTVGYRTAGSRRDSKNTRCLYCTDGLALVRELLGHNRGKDILVLDEVHEWNENIEVLLAWAKKEIEEGADFKLVIMSATLQTEEMADFFDNPAVISVPGRLFPVEEREPEWSIEEDVEKLVQAGRNVLVFQPGKREIAETISTLKERDVEAEILPLHGQLSPKEQNKCFKHYDVPKVVVSTNVAQTSVTIDDIDAVVDSGLERRIELVGGVEGLYLKPISLADSTQRKGRAGRTKEGIYIDHCDASDRPDFPVAEILRKRLDQTVLRLAIAGLDMKELEFFHQPDISEIRDARQTLIRLGCMTPEGEVTEIGRIVNRFPVSVQYGRMLVEADRLGVVDHILTVAAILEEGGITIPPPSRSNPNRPDWREMVPDDLESDIIAQLVVWEAARKMSKGEMYKKGISIRNYYRAKEIRSRLRRAVKGFLSLGSTGRREDILKAVCAGMVDHLYQGDENGENSYREISNHSVISGNPEWLVGKPFDLQIRTRRGKRVLRLIEMVSVVETEWLAEVAPQLLSIKEGIDPFYDPEEDLCVSTKRTFFNEQLIKEEEVATPKHERACKVFASWLDDKIYYEDQPEESSLAEVVSYNCQRRKRAKELNIRVGEEVFEIRSSPELKKWLQGKLKGAGRVEEIENIDNLYLPELDSKKVSRIKKENPETFNIQGKTLDIEYRREFSGEFVAETEVNEEFARSTSVEAVLLPSGRKVKLLSEDCSAYSFPELVEKLEERRIEKCWEKKRDEEEISSWISDPEEVFPHLSKLLSKVEITRINNGEGEPIFGFFSLYSDSYPDFQIRLRKSEEEAREETEIGLNRLFKKFSEKFLEIPEEEPWQEDSFWFSWELTNLGKALQRRFEETQNEISENLTPGNIESKIQEMKIAVETAKTEVGEEYFSTEEKIRRAESEFEELKETLSNEDFVEEELEEAEEIISEAESTLDSGGYKEIEKSCERLKEIKKTISQRQAKVEKGEIILNFEAWHRRGGVENNGDGWVIRPDGSLREHDFSDASRYKSDGNYRWNCVKENELALKWSCETTRNIAGSSEFEVVKIPKTEMTQAQLKAVKKIELEDIETIENSFGLDEKLAKGQAKFVKEIKDAFTSCPACGEEVKMDSYHALVGEYGVIICQKDSKISKLVNNKKPFNQQVEGRDAQVISAEKISGGVAEILAYNKWGGWNLNLRWREIDRMEELLQEQYCVCPVCKSELEWDGVHYCDQELLGAFGKHSFPIKISEINGQEVVSLVAEYDESYDEFEIQLKTDKELLDQNSEAEIETVTMWNEPAAEKEEEDSSLELEKKLQDLKDAWGA